MGYPAKKGMYKTKEGVYRFQEPGIDPGLPTKKWYHVEVTRRAFDSKGEVKRKNKQETTVFAYEDAVVGLGMRRCPTPDMGEGDVKTNVYFRPLRAEDNL
jgi:hypothetical protein